MRTAIIVMDVQESFRQLPVWAEVSNPEIVRDVDTLVQQARAEGHAVVWVMHAAPGSETAFDPELGHVRLMEGLTPDPGEPTFVKTTRNAFTSTELARYLTQEHITHLVIVGIQTEQCCETTARLAADMGYDVTFVTDATATFPIVRTDTGEVLPAQEVIERTEYALAGRFARIESKDAVSWRR